MMEFEKKREIHTGRKDPQRQADIFQSPLRISVYPCTEVAGF